MPQTKPQPSASGSAKWQIDPAINRLEIGLGWKFVAQWLNNRMSPNGSVAFNKADLAYELGVTPRTADRAVDELGPDGIGFLVIEAQEAGARGVIRGYLADPATLKVARRHTGDRQTEFGFDSNQYDGANTLDVAQDERQQDADHGSRPCHVGPSIARLPSPGETGEETPPHSVIGENAAKTPKDDRRKRRENAAPRAVLDLTSQSLDPSLNFEIAQQSRSGTVRSRFNYGRADCEVSEVRAREAAKTPNAAPVGDAIASLLAGFEAARSRWQLIDQASYLRDFALWIQDTLGGQRVIYLTPCLKIAEACHGGLLPVRVVVELIHSSGKPDIRSRGKYFTRAMQKQFRQRGIDWPTYHAT